MYCIDNAYAPLSAAKIKKKAESAKLSADYLM